MNTILKYILFSFLFVLSSCSGEDVFVANEQSPRDALVLTVSAGDFVTDGNPATRAADAGATTTFEDGDRVGIIILDDKGTPLFNNIPYKYNGGLWQFDNSNTENKTQCYYDSKAKTYIVYYPYSIDANGVTNVDDLKKKFVPREDQSTVENYRISDLLVWTSTPGTPLKTLAAELKHAYASVSVSSPIIKYTLQDGNSTEVSFVSSKISAVGLTINSNSSYKSYPAEDGSYRYILPTSFSSGDVSCVLTFNGKKYSCTVTFSTSVSANTRYTFVPTVKGGEYDLDKAQIGDFYCKNNSNEGYLIPGEIVELTDDQKSACLGIVLKVGKDDSGDWKDEGSYKQKDGTTDMPTIHGYVLALKDGNSGSTCAWGSYGTPIGTDQSQYTLFCGYSNTQTIKTYVSNTSGKTLQNDFPAAYHASEGYEQGHASPSNSSGWFLPSAGQCWYWYKNSVLLKESMDKAGGDGWYNYYWSSSVYDDNPAYGAWYVSFNRGNVYYDYKGSDPFDRVRSSLAF